MLVNTKEQNKITITIIVIKISIENSWKGKCSRLFFHLVRRQELIDFLISLTENIGFFVTDSDLFCAPNVYYN